jgi:hypothetical protein
VWLRPAAVDVLQQARKPRHREVRVDQPHFQRTTNVQLAIHNPVGGIAHISMHNLQVLNAHNHP